MLLTTQAKMADPVMLPNIIVLTLLGLVTSVLLKLLDSVWKAIATAVELFLTAYTSAFFFGYAVSFGDFGALVVAAMGIALYTRSAGPAAGSLPAKKATSSKMEEV
eukprot:gnl/TRDRNA2_/TRDRNA2_94166_c1_seq2.p1 gnl/TRDRNA2_/TRDRNA2_94166_c1~~gnl/TRDRNA2_/TRDRNA2_94166_c1_seq2.p1  ORF type:complete len:106 (+),score=17.13 gnl/TRDRNA2_/TRDRNA2_94166_c1_seq2:74-391(+)